MACPAGKWAWHLEGEVEWFLADFWILQAVQLTDLDQPLRKKIFGTESQATEDSLNLPKVWRVRELFGNPVAWTSVWAVSSTEHSGTGAIIWIMPMSFAYFSFNLLMACVLYCFSDPRRITAHDCISGNGCLWLVPWWLQNPSYFIKM